MSLDRSTRMGSSSVDYPKIVISFFLSPTGNLPYFKPAYFHWAFFKYKKWVDKHLLVRISRAILLIPLGRRNKFREGQGHGSQRSMNAKGNK